MDQNIKLRLKELSILVDVISKECRQISRDIAAPFDSILEKPIYSLLSSRRVLEIILKDVYRIEMNERAGNKSLFEILGQEKIKDKIEIPVQISMNYIRIMGNLIHSDVKEISPKNALRTLEHLCDVVEWYLTKYFQKTLPKVEYSPDLKINIPNIKDKFKELEASMLVYSIAKQLEPAGKKIKYPLVNIQGELKASQENSKTILKKVLEEVDSSAVKLETENEKGTFILNEDNFSEEIKNLIDNNNSQRSEQESQLYYHYKDMNSNEASRLIDHFAEILESIVGNTNGKSVLKFSRSFAIFGFIILIISLSFFFRYELESAAKFMMGIFVSQKPQPVPPLPVSKDSNIVLTFPTSGEIVYDNIKFEWKSPLDSSTFNLQISRDSSFKKLLQNKTIIKNNFQYRDTIPGEYYWRVKPLGVENKSSKIEKYIILPPVKIVVLTEENLRKMKKVKAKGKKFPIK